MARDSQFCLVVLSLNAVSFRVFVSLLFVFCVFFPILCLLLFIIVVIKAVQVGFACERM